MLESKHKTAVIEDSEGKEWSNATNFYIALPLHSMYSWVNYEGIAVNNNSANIYKRIQKQTGGKMTTAFNDADNVLLGPQISYIAAGASGWQGRGKDTGVGEGVG